jgi:hypothetical protein
MKSILDYLRGLVPLYERRELLNVVNSLRDEHTEYLMPTVQQIRDLLGDHQFTSKLYKSYEISLRRHINYNQPAITLLVRSIENLQALFPFLEKEIREHFGPQIASGSMSYDAVNVMRYLDSVGFYVRYARKFLIKIVADESVAAGGTPQELVKGEREYLEQNLENFAGLMVAMIKSEGELRQIFRKVSTAVVDSATADLAFKSLGNEKIDPLKLANFSPQQNWLMSIGRSWVEWQVARHKSAKDDLAALQMRLAEFEELKKSGKASPAVQKAIVKLEDRISKLDAQLKKVEEDARDEQGAAA